MAMHPTSRLLHKLILIFLLLSGISNARAQQETSLAVQANIIYHFTKYINWPADKKTGDFVIGIIDDMPLYDALTSFTANKTVGSQKIVIRKFSASAAYFNCHILFISEDESGSLKKIAAGTAGDPILLVTESEGLAHKGSCINFILIDDRLKLEINKGNIERRSLGVASELLQLGIPVK